MRFTNQLSATLRPAAAHGAALLAVLSTLGLQLSRVQAQGVFYTNWNDLVTNWVQTSAPEADWHSIASSADGTKLAAVVYAGGIYTSADSGGTWTQTSAPGANWCSIASSADGTKLAAVVNCGGIYTSADSGGTWTQTSAPGACWLSIASSADGTKLAAVVYTGIYTSADSGGTWTRTSAPEGYFYSIASSADGTKLAVVFEGGGICTSADSGGTWTRTSAPEERFYHIASSADGTRLAVVVVDPGGIYTSADSGGTWTQTSAPRAYWDSIASSADGTKLAAVGPGGTGIYTSANSGGTWTQTSAPRTDWSCIASSADATKLAAVVNGGGIYGAQAGVLPLAVFSFAPTNGVAGTPVTITGTNFIGVSAVLFNGASSSFTTDSTSQITATVPTNATFGPISIVTVNGTAISTNSFTVISPPMITAQPQSQIVSAGSSVTFSLAASGMAPFSYQWQENGVSLSDGGNVSGSSTSTLQLSSVSAADVGTYSVIVCNPIGSATSTGATLTVESVSGGFTFIDQPNDPGQCGAVVDWRQPGAGQGWITLSAPPFSPPHYFDVGVSDFAYDYACWIWFPIIGPVLIPQGMYAFGVTVHDTEPPVITGCPANTTVYAVGATGRATVSWSAPVASDNCGVAQVSSDHQPGDTFPIGVTTVTYSAADNAGNATTCSFTVTVEVPPAITIRGSSQGVQLLLNGLAGHGPVILYASTDLQSWSPVYTNPPAAGSFWYLDATVTNLPSRFYRTVVLP